MKLRDVGLEIGLAGMWHYHIMQQTPNYRLFPIEWTNAIAFELWMIKKLHEILGHTS